MRPIYNLHSSPNLSGVVATSWCVMGSSGAYFVRLDSHKACWIPETAGDGEVGSEHA